MIFCDVLPLKIAKEMKNDGMTSGVIAKYTGLTEEEFEKL